MSDYRNLPELLKRQGLFCCWRYEQRQDKPTKVPYNPRNGNRAKSTDPGSFSAFSAALMALGKSIEARQPYSGIGVGLFGNLGAIDIDHCISDNGELSEMAADIMQTMNAYTEYSPSGKGLRILFTVPDTFQYDKARYRINNQQAGLEVYIAGATNKYVTVTGNTLTPGRDLEERGDPLRMVLEKYMCRPERQIPQQAPKEPAELDDLQLIEKARRSKGGPKFTALWSGDASSYKSRSEADQALCNILAFWTNRDPARMDRLFRWSGLMREKWDRRQSGSTYGALTIQRAIADARSGYDPQVRPGPERAAASTPAKDTGPVRPPEPPPDHSEVQPLSITPAPVLQKANLPPVKFLIEGILPDGTSLLTAASKIGKSWMVLDLGLSQAAGGLFMGHQCNQCGVLYLALEDSLHRLQDRMNKILGGKPAPEQFYFATEAPKLDNGLLDTLEDHLKKHPDTRLIIIDTLQKIRGQALPREASYAQDYREMETVKAFMDKRGISTIFVHHNRKMKDDDDPFNMISGTNGIMGAADTIWTITKAKRTDEEATLHITGRDVEQSDTVIQFNKNTWRWETVGEAGALAEQRAREEYDSSPIVKTIKKLLEQSPGHRWDGQAKDLMEAGKYIARAYLATDVQKLGYTIKALEKPLFDFDGIVHSTSKTNGNGGRKHHFYYQDLSQFEEMDGEQEGIPWQTT